MSRLITYAQRPRPFLSTHDEISILYSCDVAGRDRRPITFHSRDYSGLDSDDFRLALAALQLPDAFASPDVDEKLTILQACVDNLLSRFAPLRSRSMKRSAPPWITHTLRAQMRLRECWRQRHRRSGAHADLMRYRELRASVKKRLAEARITHIRSCLDRVGSNTKQYWSLLRRLGVVPPTRASELDATRFASGDLNAYFCSVFGPPPTQDTLNASDHRQFDDTEYYFRYLGPDELRKHLRFASSNAAGVDGLSGRLLRYLFPSILYPVLSLFNSSLSSSTFPAAWKAAIITPVPKVKNPASEEDFRPISNLPELSKVLERVVLDDMRAYLSSSGFCDEMQCGFTPGLSTQSALVKVTDDIRRAIDIRQCTILVLFDFSKAFDTVDHGILLDKLASLRFSAPVLAWFRSYLLGRTQSVRVGQDLSPWLPVTSGVPQGSVLGPALFSLYVSDVGDCITHSQYVKYADDLQIYAHCSPSNIMDCVREVNEDIGRIITWAAAKRLRLNPLKTKVLLIASPPIHTLLRAAAPPCVEVGGEPIPYSLIARNLGLIMTATLSWSDHVTFLCSRVYRTLNYLRVRASALPLGVRRSLATALVLPLFDYCLVVYPDLRASDDQRLDRALSATVRFVYGLRKFDHISAFYTRLNWLRLPDRRRYMLGAFLFVLMHSDFPRFIARHITRVGDDRSRPTRQPSDDIVVPFARGHVAYNSILATAARSWNSLPAQVRAAGSVAAFKAQLYQHLLGMSTA